VKLGPTGGSKLVGVLTATALIVTGRAQSGAGRRLSSRADDSHAAAVARAASTPVGWLDSGWVRLVPTSNGLRRHAERPPTSSALPCPAPCSCRHRCLVGCLAGSVIRSSSASQGTAFCSRSAGLWSLRATSVSTGRGKGAWPSRQPHGRPRFRSPVSGGGRSPPSTCTGRRAPSTSARRGPARTSMGCCCDGESAGWSWP
jgi:hypothetical protein